MNFRRQVQFVTRDDAEFLAYTIFREVVVVRVDDNHVRSRIAAA